MIFSPLNNATTLFAHKVFFSYEIHRAQIEEMKLFFLILCVIVRILYSYMRF